MQRRLRHETAQFQHWRNRAQSQSVCASWNYEPRSHGSINLLASEILEVIPTPLPEGSNRPIEACYFGD